MADNPIYDNQNRGVDITYSQLIRIGVCVDNNDPQRAGRIRALLNQGEGVTNPKITDPIKAIVKLDREGKYIPWSKNDPYTFDPFLPLHINVIPRKSEAIKLISYETIKDNLNQEYIGPMISQPGQIKGDSFSSGQQNTSFGIQNIREPDFAPQGIPLPEGKGSFPNPDDIAIVGRDNCDIILGMREKSILDETVQPVEDWYPQILIRSGKFIPNKKISSRPTFNKKPTFIQLNTFPQTLTNKEKEVEKVKMEDAPLNALFEYFLDTSTLGPFSGNIVVYKMPYGSPTTGKPYLSSEFTSQTNVPPPITTTNFIVPPLIGNMFCRVSFNNIATIQEVSTIINDILNKFDKGLWSDLMKDSPTTSIAFNPIVNTNDANSLANFFPSTTTPTIFPT